MMEIIREEKGEEDPARPPMQITVHFAGVADDGTDQYEIEEALNGIDGAVATAVMLQLAASYLDRLCPAVTQQGRGPMLLNGLAYSIRDHYQTHTHPHTDGATHA